MPVIVPTTYVFRVLWTLFNVSPCSVGKLSVPDKVLRTMQFAPVPMSSHDGTNEIWVVLVWSVISDEIAVLNLVRGSGDNSNCRQS